MYVCLLASILHLCCLQHTHYNSLCFNPLTLYLYPLIVYLHPAIVPVSPIPHATSTSNALAETSSDGRTILTADSEDGGRKWDFLDFSIDWLAVRNIAMPLITKFTFRTNGTCLSPRYHFWHVLSCAILSYTVLSCPVLSCPVLCYLDQNRYYPIGKFSLLLALPNLI